MSGSPPPPASTLDAIIAGLEAALRSHKAYCSMCNGAWNDGPCKVGTGINDALALLAEGEVRYSNGATLWAEPPTRGEGIDPDERRVLVIPVSVDDPQEPNDA